LNYILNKINNRIELLEKMDNEQALQTQYQSRFEFMLIYIMAYLWDKNFQEIQDEDKEFILQKITQPSIGTIVSICRKLDIEKNIFKKGKLQKALDDYPNIRNEKIGHGYVFENELHNFITLLNDLYKDIIDSKLSFLSKNIDLIYVSKFENDVYQGICYKANGISPISWSCPKEIVSFKTNNLYGTYELNKYFRLSPFIDIQSFGDKIYIFRDITEKLLGKVRYNRLLETGTDILEWKEFINLDIRSDGIKRKTSNGTIINIYDNNYETYIENTNINTEIRKFLTKNKASVCATIWGHGGVGKTAMVQNICEDLIKSERKTFDYIIFLSAKDRKYDYYTGLIIDIKENISTFNEVIQTINLILFNKESDSIDEIIKYNGKTLFIIDDFETFPREEKEKIEEFISQLNTNNHKVIITTRVVNIKVGQEYQTNELSEKETTKFLFDILEDKNIGHLAQIKKELSDDKKIYKMTGGRPLFIFQFAYILGQKGVNDTFNFEIKESETAINFLYGRIYSYLSQNAKDLFDVLSLLVSQDDLSNVIEKAQYILQLEFLEDRFNSSVDELKKLKVIKVDEDNRFFDIYSKEIFQIMQESFTKRESGFKGSCISRRDQINKDKKLDVEHSLLLTANANRLSKNEVEVIDSYKQILNRSTSPIKIKLEAILNLAAYLVDRGKKELALENFNDNAHFFNLIKRKNNIERENIALFYKMWATYNWSGNSKKHKEKAVKILLDYSSLQGYNYNLNIDLELSGMLLLYRSSFIIDEWQDLKEKKDYGEISENNFWKIRKKQKQACKDVHDKNGIFLFNKFKTLELNQISSGAKQNLVTGLYTFLEVLARLDKFKLAKDICEYIIKYAPINFHPQFQKKKEWYCSILSKETDRTKNSKNNIIVSTDTSKWKGITIVKKNI